MADHTAAVEKYYVEYFGRPADSAGFQYWNNVFDTDPNAVANISAQFAASAEYKDSYAGMDNTARVQAIYQNLFGHAGDTAGLNYWVNLLNNNSVTIDNAVDKIAAGAQGTDAVVVTGRVAVASVFTQHLDTQVEQQAYAGANANAMAKAFLGSVVSLETGAQAVDPGVVDAKIAEIVGAHTNADVAHFVV